MRYNSQIHHRRSIRLKGYDYAQAGAYFITICCQNRLCRFGKISVGVTLAVTPAVSPTVTPTTVTPTGSGVHMELNEYGLIAYEEWNKLPERFSNVELDVFQIMPNHMHGIIVLHETVGVGFTPTQNTQNTQNTQIGQGQPQGLPQQEPKLVPIPELVPEPKLVPVPKLILEQVPDIVPKSVKISNIVGAYKSLVANRCIDVYNQKNETMGKLWQRNYHEHIIRNNQSYQLISEYIINNPAKWHEDKFFIK